MNIMEQLLTSRTTCWEPLAKQIGGHFIKDGFAMHGRGGVGCLVSLAMEEWFIYLEEYFSDGDSTGYPQMRAPYQDKNGFRFKIISKGIFTKIGKLFGMQDLIIGDADFDDEFIIQSNDEEKVRAFFDSPRLRQLIKAQPYVSFGIREEKPVVESLFSWSNVELFSYAHDDKDVARMKSMFEMFGEALRQLRRIGSA